MPRKRKGERRKKKKENIMRRLVLFVPAVVAVIILAAVLTSSSPSKKMWITVHDPCGDDYGPGTYTYPVDYTFRTENFGKRESFDITKFSTYEDGDQLVLEYRLSQSIADPWGGEQTKKYDISLQAIDAYLDTGISGGYTDLIFDQTIPGNVAKNPNGTLNAVIEAESDWEYAIRAQGWEVSIFTNPTGENGGKKSMGRMEVDKESGIIRIYAPKSLIGTPDSSWKITTFIYGIDYGNARVVNSHASGWNFGGGRDDSCDPNIIDIIVPEGHTQESVLDFTSSPVVLKAVPFGSGEYTSSKGAVSVSPQPTGLDPSEIPPTENLLDEIVRRGVMYFWDWADNETGLIRDTTKYAYDEFPASTASTGFGLTALIIGAHRGWLDNSAVYNRVLTTLRSFHDNTDDNPNDLVVDGENGLFYHFIRMSTGDRWTPSSMGKPGESSELSTIDTALFLAGAITAGEYYKGTEVEEIAREIYESADWRWMLSPENQLYHGWTPERGYLPNKWEYYSEAMILYLLAIGSPTYPIPAECWHAWERPLNYVGTTKTYIMSPPESLFTYQYSHAWIDFREKHDHYANYWQNSVYACQNNRNFVIWVAINGPTDRYLAFDDDIWGLTAGDAPCTKTGYKNYGATLGGYDGTIHPYGMVASLPFVPELSLRGINALLERYGREIWREYGFTSGFNPDVDWYSHEYTGIDVGIQVIMVQNYLDNFVWNLFMNNEYIQRAMTLAGFQSGALENKRAITEEYEREYTVPTETKEATARRAMVAINIDGRLNDWSGAEWYAVPPNNKVMGTIRFDIENVSSEFSAIWDDEHLYLACNVTDTIVVSNIEPDDVHSLYRSDSVEFYLQPDRFISTATGIFKIAVIPFDTSGNPQACRHEDMNPGPISSVAPGIKIGSSRTSSGYIIEVAIPWSYLQINPASGVKMGINHTVHNTYFSNAEPGEYVRTAMLSWVRVSVVWSRPTTWGVLTLE
ncbi:MAG: glucoamylase family protein [Candidatus Hadarchaeales archaeon]